MDEVQAFVEGVIAEEPQPEFMIEDVIPVETAAPFAPPAPQVEQQEIVQEEAGVEAAPEPVEEQVEAAEAEQEEPAPEAKAKTPSKPKASTPKAKTPKEKPAPAAEGGEGRARRERKTVQHFEVAKPKEEVQIMMEGKGTKLRDIPNVAFKMSKITGKDELMESFHNVLYRRKGVANTRKKAILDFNGFAFDAENEEKEIEGRKASLGKWKLELIHKLMDTLDLPRGAGDKAVKIDRVFEFLMKPSKLSDVDLAAKEAAKKEKEKRKRERAAAQKAKEAAKKRKSTDGKAAGSKKKAKTEDSDSEVTEDSEEEDEPVTESEAESESEEEAPKKKKATPAKKKVTPAKKPPSAKKTPTKRTPAKKSEEDEPVMNLSAEQIKKDVVDVLSKMDDEELGQLTVKIMMAKMGEFYGYEVKPRKAEFKAAMHEYAEVRMGSGEAAEAAPAAPAAEEKVEEPAAEPSAPADAE